VAIHKKKRAFEAVRLAANTKLVEKRIKKIRVMGGNFKYRDLRVQIGNFNWAS
jgi:small subunit ribosomal protein S8e